MHIKMTSSCRAVTYISPRVLYHQLARRLESLSQSPDLVHQLVASSLATALQAVVEPVNLLEKARHIIDIARPGGSGEISCLGHGGVSLRRTADFATRGSGKPRGW